ncbi:SRPBCC family protein [Pseudoxanthomonas mexicana]|uniref:SRPBCC family protein n=1 Tax=Pseudoxanthomonas mexicana TaxID=128785 RepID=UPI00398B58AD
MKLLKPALAIALLLGTLLLGGSLLLPPTTRVERVVVIDRPQAEVFARLDSLREFPRWSPWAQDDPDIRYTFSGPASGVGAKMEWSGNPAVGSGHQIIRRSEPYRLVAVEQAFGGRVSLATYTLSPGNGGTEVIWSIEMAHGLNPLSRWVGWMAAPMIGGDFERGLARLKAMLEAQD